MENEHRIAELLSEMLLKFDILNDEVKIMSGRLESVDGRLGRVEKGLEKVENEIIKLNLISAENSRALMKLADNNDRINRLEKAVFK